jgi:hypothetical protein
VQTRQQPVAEAYVAPLAVLKAFNLFSDRRFGPGVGFIAPWMAQLVLQHTPEARGYPQDLPAVTEAVKLGMDVGNYLDGVREGKWEVLREEAA